MSAAADGPWEALLRAFATATPPPLQDPGQDLPGTLASPNTQLVIPMEFRFHGQLSSLLQEIAPRDRPSPKLTRTALPARQQPAKRSRQAAQRGQEHLSTLLSPKKKHKSSDSE